MLDDGREAGIFLERCDALHEGDLSLPVGAFTYSQGIEWAVEVGWISTAADLEAWLTDQLQHAVARVDLPLLARMHAAASVNDPKAMDGWIDWLHACRETSELSLEEANRGRALADLVLAWELPGASEWRPVLTRSRAAGFAFAAAAWAILTSETLLAYAWGWLENLVLAAVKIVPLGQTQGQQILQRLVTRIPGLVQLALATDDDAIGASSPALAIASSAHETQYTRLFRS